MNHVHEGLIAQKRNWSRLANRVLKSGLPQELPPRPPSRILLLGEGRGLCSAKLLALSLRREMMRKGGRQIPPVLACASVQMGFEVFPDKYDWVFALSHDDSTEVTLRAFEKCDKAGAFTVWVTADEDQKPEFGRLQVVVGEPGDKPGKTLQRGVDIISPICAVSTLLLGSQAVEIWSALSSSKNPPLEGLQSRIQAPPTVVLGEWEGEWIAREIALELNEVAGVRVPAYSSEEYYHGPHFVSSHLEPRLASKSESGTESIDSIWYVSVPGDVRESQFSPIYRVKALENQLFSWVPALVELQWLTFALALHLRKSQ